MIDSASRPLGSSPADAVAGKRRRRESVLVSLILGVPLVLFAISLFLVRPLSLGETFSLMLLAPGLLIVGLLTVRIPRSYFLSSLGRVGIEFALLTLIVALSILSLVNSEEPLRSFRIVYPSVLPMAIFAHLVVVAYLAPERLAKIPRLLIVCAFVFSVGPLFLSMAVPPLKAHLFGEYRFRGMFENSIQHSIALATIVPLVVVQFITARAGARKLAWGLALLVFAYTAFRAGSKTAMFVGFAGGAMLYVVLALRTRSFLKIGIMVAVMGLLAFVVWTRGLAIAEMINPVTAEKLRTIIEGGVANYQSIESRKELWSTAIDEGRRHWIVGTGAGEKVLGISHAHNLVLDYFKGIGFFGASAIVLLCVTILARTGGKTLSVLAGRGNERDIRILACYFGASVYVICNQLSDCFGPSTIGFLWLPYLAGRLMERGRPDVGPQSFATGSRVRDVAPGPDSAGADAATGAEAELGAPSQN